MSLTKTKGHVDALDGIRGIAILVVMMCHLQTFGVLPRDTPTLHKIAGLMLTGWTGVDLFFALSGFLITGILLDTSAAANRVSSFYMRRVLRIFPLYYFVVLAAIVTGRLLIHHDWVYQGYPTWKGWASYLLYFPNWWIPIEEPNHLIVGHFWSLGVEEQFYMMWPPLLWLIARKNLWKACVAGIVIAFLLRFVMLHEIANQSSRIIQMNTFARMDSLLAGALGAVIVRDAGMLKRVKPFLPAAFLLAVGGMFWIEIIKHEIWTTAHYTQLYGFSFLAIGCASGVTWAYINRGGGGLIERGLALAPLTAFGKYSYGIYVYHIAVFQIGYLVFRHQRWYGQYLEHSILLSCVLVAASFGVAFLSFQLFEKRFLNLKKYFRATTSAPNIAKDVALA